MALLALAGIQFLMKSTFCKALGLPVSAMVGCKMIPGLHTAVDTPITDFIPLGKYIEKIIFLDTEVERWVCVLKFQGINVYSMYASLIFTRPFMNYRDRQLDI